MGKTHLFGLEKTELLTLLEERSLPKWRGDQLWSWVHQHGVSSFDAMLNLPKSLREDLSLGFTLERPKIINHSLSSDGTEKWAVAFEDEESVEMVLIPEGERQTLCVSSQVGCPVHCAFCCTGTQGFTRNLTSHEIVGQVFLARDVLNDRGHTNVKRSLTNIVMMGMGEPLYNYANVSKALRIIMDPEGMALSKRRITLSTSGVVPFIERCGQELGVNLAVSLHAPNDEIRQRIMPINKQYNIESLLSACRAYPGLHEARKMTFEYVMLAGINDATEHAKELVQRIHDLPAKVNLIPWNPWPGATFQSSSPQQIQAFARTLEKCGVTAFVRSPRGQDIAAACGQLKTQSTPASPLT